MAGAYAKIPSNTFEHIALDAFMVLRKFDPDTGEYAESDILGVTTGGSSVNVTIDHTDLGEDIDNCHKNTKQLMRVDNITPVASGTLVTFTPEVARRLMAHADQAPQAPVYKIVPRNTVDIEKDFKDLWFVNNYSDVNTGSNPGFIAVHFYDCMSTGGFQMQTTEKAKTQWAFEFTAHYSLDAQDNVPYEVYLKQGTSSSQNPEILLDRHSATIEVEDELKLAVMRRVPATGSALTWSSSDTTKATVSNLGVVTGVAQGNVIITATLTVNSVPYTDTCTVIVEDQYTP